MPETSTQPGSTRPKTDRRAHPRQKIQSLTYVELGGGNGGIALNVSEGGMTWSLRSRWTPKARSKSRCNFRRRASASR